MRVGIFRLVSAVADLAARRRPYAASVRAHSHLSPATRGGPNRRCLVRAVSKLLKAGRATSEGDGLQTPEI